MHLKNSWETFLHIIRNKIFLPKLIFFYVKYASVTVINLLYIIFDRSFKIIQELEYRLQTLSTQEQQFEVFEKSVKQIPILEKEITRLKNENNTHR